VMGRNAAATNHRRRDGRPAQRASLFALLALLLACGLPAQAQDDAKPPAQPAGIRKMTSFSGNGGVYYTLEDRNIVPGSESVRVGVQPMIRNVDYVLNPTAGTITFMEPVSRLQRAYVSYRVDPAKATPNTSLRMGTALAFAPGLRGIYASSSAAGSARLTGGGDSQLFGFTYSRQFAQTTESAGAKPANGGAAQIPGGIQAMWFTGSMGTNPLSNLQAAKDPITNLVSQLMPGAKPRRQPAGGLARFGIDGLSFRGGTVSGVYERVDRNLNFELLQQQFADPSEQALAQGLQNRAGMQTLGFSAKDIALGKGKLAFATTRASDGSGSAFENSFSYDAGATAFSFSKLMVGKQFQRPEASLLSSAAVAAKLKGASVTKMAARTEIAGIGKLAFNSVGVSDGAEGALQQSMSLEGKRGKIAVNTQRISANYNRDNGATGLQGDVGKQKGLNTKSVVAEYAFSPTTKWAANYQSVLNVKTGKLDTQTVNALDMLLGSTKLHFQNETTATRDLSKGGPRSSQQKTSMDIAGTYGKGLNLHAYTELVRLRNGNTSASSSLTRMEFAWDRGKAMKLSGMQQFEKLAEGGTKSTTHMDLADKFGRFNFAASYNSWRASKDNIASGETLIKTHLDGAVTKWMNLTLDQENQRNIGRDGRLLRNLVLDGKLAGVRFKETNFIHDQGPKNVEKSNNLEFQWAEEIPVGDAPKPSAQPAAAGDAPQAQPKPAEASLVAAAPKQAEPAPPQAAPAQPAPAPQPASGNAPAPQAQSPDAKPAPPPEPAKIQVSVQGNLMTKDQTQQGDSGQTNLAVSTALVQGKDQTIGLNGGLKTSKVAGKEDRKEVTAELAARLPLESSLSARMTRITNKGTTLQSVSTVEFARPLRVGQLRLEFGSAKLTDSSPVFATMGYGLCSKPNPKSRADWGTMFRTFAGPKGEKVIAYEHAITYRASTNLTLIARAYRNPANKDPKVVYNPVSGYGLQFATNLFHLKTDLGFNWEQALSDRKSALVTNLGFSGRLGPGTLEFSYNTRLATQFLADRPTQWVKLSYGYQLNETNKLSITGEYKAFSDRDPNTKDSRNLTARVDLVHQF